MTPTDVSFHGQPGGDPFGEVLRGLLVDPDLTNLTIVVAWARYRGLARIEYELCAFRARGHSRIVLGIDEGGGTHPGLLAALELFSEAFVYHEHGPGTFHPKIYLARGDTKAVLAVGSSNATPGGLFLNHEASLVVAFDLPADADHPALTDATSYVDALLADEGVCLSLTKGIVNELVATAAYRVATDEAARPRPDVVLPAGADDEDLDSGGSDEAQDGEQPTFGKSRHSKPTVPPLSQEAKNKLEAFESATLAIHVPPAAPPPLAMPPFPPPAASPPALSPPPTPFPAPPVATAQPSSPPPGTTVIHSWVKRDLPRTDAQQQHVVKPRTNPTNNLRLTQAHNPIDWRTFFRNELFGAAAWNPTTDRNNNPIEEATVTIDVVVTGASLGPMAFLIDHAPHRQSDQHNHATVLHWDPLKAVLQATDYTGRDVWLSRFSDGSYRLEIV